MRKTREQKIGETAALVALTENGLDRADAARALGLTKKQVDERLDDARLELAARAKEYVDLHLAASKEAALKGKAEPMQWALERIGVVSPPATAAPGGGGGTIIKIGIALPGLAPGVGQVITVTPDAVTTEPA